jgi:hypothetical protein
MRLRARPILALILMSLFLVAAQTWRTSTSDLKPPGPSARSAREAFQQARPSLVYPLTKERWLSFDLPVGTTALRFMTNAELPAGMGLDAEVLDEEVLYAVEGRLDDAPSFVRHQRSRPSYDAQLDWPACFYESGSGGDTSPVVLDSRIERLSLTAGVQRLQLRLASVEGPITSAAVRVYARQEVPEEDLRDRWRQLTPGKRRVLARGNVYPVSLLATDEKTDLLRFRWLPLAPRVASHLKRRLYTLETSTAPWQESDVEEAAATLSAVTLSEVDATEVSRLFVDPVTTAGTEYVVVHDGDENGGEGVPFRVEVWALSPGTGKVARLRWELLGADGETLSKGRIVPARTPSSVALLDDGEAVGESVQRFFHLSPRVRRLRLRTVGEGSLVVAVSNRPADLARVFVVPPGPRPSGRTWFALSPEGGGEPRRLAVRQPPELERTAKDWQSLEPAGEWRGRDLLVPLSEPGRRSSAASQFRQVEAERKLKLRFVGKGKTVEPSLFFERREVTPFRVEVRLAGKVVLTRRLGGRRGLFILPSVRAGKREFSVACSDGDAAWWLSHAAGGDAVRARRLAFPLEGETVVPFEKRTAGEEMVTLRLFAPRGRKASTRLGVRITGRPQGLGPLKDWTLTDRVYKVAPGDGEAIPLTSDRLRLDGGRTFGVRLGRDLPPGSYELRLASLDGKGSYVTASRAVVGR